MFCWFYLEFRHKAFHQSRLSEPVVQNKVSWLARHSLSAALVRTETCELTSPKEKYHRRRSRCKASCYSWWRSAYPIPLIVTHIFFLSLNWCQINGAFQSKILLHHHHHQSLNREGPWGTTDDFATSFLHFFVFSTALWDLANSRPVHSLMLSSHLFLCLPCLLPPFTVPCKMVLARPDEREPWPYHCSLRLFTIVRRSSCGPIACWILARTSSLVSGFKCDLLYMLDTRCLRRLVPFRCGKNTW